MYFEEEISNFCKNVGELRFKNKLTKKEMADILGTSVRSITLIEKGIIPPRLSVRVLVNIYNYFNILPNKLFEI